MENNINRHGATSKYEMIEAVEAHVAGVKHGMAQTAVQQQQPLAAKPVGYDLLFANSENLEIAFETAKTLQHIMLKESDVETKFAMLQAMTKALHTHIVSTMTGPTADTSRIFVDKVNTNIAEVWFDFLSDDKLSTAQFRAYTAECAKLSPGPHGYPAILALIGDDIAEGIADASLRDWFLGLVDSVDQTGRVKDSRSHKRRALTETRVKTEPEPKVELSKPAESPVLTKRAKVNDENLVNASSMLPI